MSEIKYNHAEAFCLMQYRCEKCGSTETLWNSRDGVTPFIVACRKCKGHMQHINWHQDKRVLDYFPEPGMRIFTDLTKQIANIEYRVLVNKLWNVGDYPLKKSFKTKEDALKMYLENLDETQPYIFITKGDD
jgi:hypothetical protein